MQLKFTCMQPLVLDEISFGVVGFIAAFVGTYEGFLWRNSVQTIFSLRKTVGHKVCVQLCSREEPLLGISSDQFVGGNGHDVNPLLRHPLVTVFLMILEGVFRTELLTTIHMRTSEGCLPGT